MPDRIFSRLETAVIAIGVAAVVFMQVNQGQVFAAFSTRSEAVPAATTAAPVPVEWPATIGAADATYTVAVAVLRSTVVTGRRTATIQTTIAEERRMLETLEQAEAAIRSWSDGTVSVRFELTVVDAPLTIVRARGDEWWRWPRQDGVATALGGATAKADMLLALWNDRHTVGGANLAGGSILSGRLLPYLSIPITDRSSSTQSAEALVHEFCHGLETLDRQAGVERPNLHDTTRYGYTVGADGSWADWYRFYLTHPSVEAADAAGRTPLASPTAPVVESGH